MLQRRSRKLAPWHSSVGLSCSGLGPCILKPEAYEGAKSLVRKRFKGASIKTGCRLPTMFPHPVLLNLYVELSRTSNISDGYTIVRLTEVDVILFWVHP